MEDLVKGAIDGTSKKEHKQFLELTERLIDIMTEFCLLTLQIIEKKKTRTLEYSANR